MTDIKTVPQRLREAADLFEKRNAAYGGNYREFGRVMSALFPDGLGDGNLSEAEFGRLSHVVHIMTKLTRYCRNLRRDGHADSLEDMAVYAMMSSELDDAVVFSQAPRSMEAEETGGRTTVEDPPEAAVSCEWRRETPAVDLQPVVGALAPWEKSPTLTRNQYRSLLDEPGG